MSVAEAPYTSARKQAERALAEHEMTILHEDGLYRHLRFAKPGTYIYGFDLVTWPGYLTICGDLEDFTFCRTDDMINFFASGPDINPGYWGEKIVNRRLPLQVYSRPAFEELLDRDLGYAAEVRDEGWREGAERAWREHVEWVDLDHEYPAMQAARDFEHDGFRFDIFEWEPTDWDHHFLLACFAIRRGVEIYRKAQQAKAAAEHPGSDAPAAASAPCKPKTDGGGSSASEEGER